MGKLMNILSGERDSIPYRKDLNRITGSVTAAILLQQIIFRWDSNGGKEFYKFKEPCDHEKYRDGDSWIEEIGFSRSEFDTARDMIGSKFSANVPMDKFALIWYRTDSSRVTQYFVNEPLVEMFLDLMVDVEHKSVKSPLYVKKESHFTKSTIPSLVQYSTETTADNPLTPTRGGTDTQPEPPPTKKAKASKKAGAACAAATEADFSNFANPELALSIWSTWVDYKRQQKNFTYKSDVAQAAAITKLFNCSGGSIQKARAVIEDAMANGYSGFFPYRDEMAASVRPQQIEIPVTDDTFHLEPEMLERYTSTTKWFYTKCPACTGIRWLSKKEFLSVMQRSQDLIAEMWYTKCPEEDFNGHVTKSIVSLNAAPRWEKEKWPSIFEWLRHDLKIRIFGKKDNQ